MTDLDAACLMKELADYNNSGRMSTPAMPGSEADIVFQGAIDHAIRALEHRAGAASVTYQKNGNGSYSVVSWDPEPEEKASSPKPRAELPHGHFDRAGFTETLRRALGDAGIDELEDACLAGASKGDFKCWYDEGDYYVCHMPSGMTINWYKHLGRANTCSKPDASLSDLWDFMRRRREELDLD